MSEEKTIAYCMKCKAKREMSTEEAVYTANGSPATRGVCSVCSCTMFRMGRTEAHDSIPKPAKQPTKN